MSAQDLAEEFKGQNVVLVCGAGISVAAPTNLPSGVDLKTPFIGQIRRALANAGAPNLVFPDDAVPRMPERTIEPFYNVFGESVFAILDSFFTITPNHNHHNIAQIARLGMLTDVITVNFDYAIEDAYARLSSDGSEPVVFASQQEFSRQTAVGGLRLHKPHGTLLKHAKDAPPSARYGSIAITVERIGTAIDSHLVQWFKEVIGDRSIFVAGYSGGDLDVFPALTQAMGSGRVYWNELSTPSFLTARWLEKLGGSGDTLCCDVACVLEAVADYLGLDPAVQNEMNERRVLSLASIEDDTAGVLLAAAWMCHSTESRKHAGLRDALIELLLTEPHRSAVRKDPKKQAWLSILTAGRDHETAAFEAAATGYRAVKASMNYSQERNNSIPQSVTDGLVLNIAYDEASPFKRRPVSSLFDRQARGSLLKLVRHAFGDSVLIGNDVRARAAHFLAEFPLSWAFILDIAAPKNPLARLLYWTAHALFTKAMRDGAKSIFSQMRRDETLLHMLRSQWFSKADCRVLSALDSSLEHYSYLNGDPDAVRLEPGRAAMDGDAARGVFLLMAAMRSAISCDQQRVRTRLDSAWRLFISAKSGSGVYRAQLYEWLLNDAETSWFRTLPVAAIRLKHLVTLREWFKTGSAHAN